MSTQSTLAGALTSRCAVPSLDEVQIQMPLRTRPTAFEKDVMIGNPDAYRPVDPLVELLCSIRCTGVIQACARLSAPWGVDLPQESDAILVYFILSGTCVVFPRPEGEFITLTEGDVLVVPRVYPHAMADSTTTKLVPFDDIVPSDLLVAPSANDFLANLFRAANRYGGGGSETYIATLRVFVDNRFPQAMLRGLPRLIYLRGFATRHRAFVEHTIAHISEYGASGFLGQASATRLSEALLTACIEEYLTNSPEGRAGIHRGLRDPFLSKALGAMLNSPQLEWPIQTLAGLAAMSKSAFIKRFSDVIGWTPNEFLVSLRMSRASEFLQNSSLSLASIASAVGYGSEASFKGALSNNMNTQPGRMW